MSTLLASGASAALLLALAVPPAAASSQADFGHHVHTCAQTMKFDAEHNPGMHQGASAWAPGHHC
jgi:hypothetical protein